MTSLGVPFDPSTIELPSLTHAADRRFLDRLLVAGKGGKVRRGLRAATAAERASAAVSLLEAYADLRRDVADLRAAGLSGFEIADATERMLKLARELLGKKLPLTEAQAVRLGQLAAESNLFNFGFPTNLVIRAIAAFCDEHGVPEDLRPILEGIRHALKDSYDGNQRRVYRTVSALLGGDPPADAGERWADRLLADLANLPAAERAAWETLLAHGVAVGRTKPAKKWLKAGRPLFDAVGQEAFEARLRVWLRALGRGQVAARNSEVLRGLIACCHLLDGSEMAPVLGSLALTSFARANGGGRVCSKAGLACVHALARFADRPALVQLVRIQREARAEWAAHHIDRAVRDTAEGLGAEPEDVASEVDDLDADTLGLEDPEQWRFDYGPRCFELVITPDLKPKVRADSGKLLARAPKPGKSDYKELATESHNRYKDVARDLRRAFKQQPRRLENAMVNGTRWTAGDFTRKMIDHPVMRHLTLGLLWSTYNAGAPLARHDASAPPARPGDESTAGAAFRISEERELLDVEDEAFALADDAAVGLIHPIELDGEALDAWRSVFADYEIVPPFPQLDRPVHRPTDAEGAATRLERHAGRGVEPRPFLFGLEAAGWQRPALEGGLWIGWMSRPFDRFGITAVVHCEVDGRFLTGDDVDTGRLRHVELFRGLPGASSRLDPPDVPALELGEVPELVISEVIYDLDGVSL